MSEWISVKDKTPITSMIVLIKTIENEYLVGKFGNFEFVDLYGDYDDADEDGCVNRNGFYYEREDNGEFEWLIFDMNEKVTHWMPLPDPPKNPELAV